MLNSLCIQDILPNVRPHPQALGSASTCILLRIASPISVWGCHSPPLLSPQTMPQAGDSQAPALLLGLGRAELNKGLLWGPCKAPSPDPGLKAAAMETRPLNTWPCTSWGGSGAVTCCPQMWQDRWEMEKGCRAWPECERPGPQPAQGDALPGGQLCWPPLALCAVWPCGLSERP